MWILELLLSYAKEIIGLAALLFGIYKWRFSGARVRLRVTSSDQRYGHLAMLIQPGQELVVVEAVNVGRQNTVLTHLFASYYENIWQRLLKMNEKTYVITPSPNLANGLPFDLEPGARWVGASYQPAWVAEASRNGHLIIGMHHSAGRSSVRKRLIVPK